MPRRHSGKTIFQVVRNKTEKKQRMWIYFAFLVGTVGVQVHAGCIANKQTCYVDYGGPDGSVCVPFSFLVNKPFLLCDGDGE